MEEEIWKDVPDFEGFYQVSNLGRVRRVGRERCKECGFRGRPERILKCTASWRKDKGVYNYKVASMSKPGMGTRRGITRTVHKMVAEAFIPKIPGKDIVNHKDSNNQNNRADNLEWVTSSENFRHALAKGRWKRESPQEYGRRSSIRWAKVRANNARNS